MKKFLLIILGIFAFNINASAATGTGICYGREIITGDGYCKLDAPISIGRSIFNPDPLKLTNGSRAVTFNYTGTIDGKQQDMFCLDANLSAPSGNDYIYARPFKVSTGYDHAIAKIYTMYVNDSAYLVSQGWDTNRAFKEYLQIANTAMRAITARQGYDVGEGTFNNHFPNIYKQLEGLPANKPVIADESSQAYKTAQRYYCSAILTSTLSSNSGSNLGAAKAACEKVLGTSKVPVTPFEYTFVADANDIKMTGNNPNKFEMTVPVKIKGLERFNTSYDTYSKTNPYFKITGVKCSNDALTCTLKNTGLLNSNLIVNGSTAAEYPIEVIVSGNTADFKNNTKEKIEFVYASSHIMDTNNLIILKNSIAKLTHQRMIVLMPERSQKGDAQISINTPSMCEVKITNGRPEYYYGGVKQNSALEYMQKGCCNVEPTDLTTDVEKEHYLNTCATEDIVQLVTKCDNDGDKYNQSESLVIQQPINKIRELVTNAESNPAYSKRDVENQLKKLDNNRDDYYLYNTTDLSNTIVSRTNDYCKMYTSEEMHIYYPGTAEAKSGRFFIFGEDEQPKVDGKIDGNFHTDYERWKKDYEKAIEDEKAAYTLWQTALAVENALAKVDSEVTCYLSGSCGCCNPTVNKDGVPSCTGACYDRYSGTDSRNADYGTFYTADGVDLGYVRATKHCGCDNDGSLSSSPSSPGSSSTLGRRYRDAVRHREQLQTFKKECESKQHIDRTWTYFLDPDLKFTYKQEYFDPITNKKVELKNEVDMVVSTEAVKYWPNVSTNASQIRGSQKGRRNEHRFIVKYGGGSSRIDEIHPFDQTKDYEVGYEQTLFYKPTVQYYSLLPDGHYVTEVNNYSGQDYLDIGYVFNVNVTTYQNEYYTWFTIGNTGHLMRSPKIKPKLKSNVQNSIDLYLEKINDNELKAVYGNEGIDQDLFNSVCYYDNEEIIYKRDCPTCEPVSGDDPFRAQYFTRTVSMTNPFPNEGVQGRETGENWSNTKGAAARTEIIKLGDQIYNDATKEYLEASIILTPTMMQETRKKSKENRLTDFNLSCAADGKECVSSFLEDLTKQSKTEDILYKNRANNWKYYEDGRWQRGSIRTIFGRNGYPDADQNRTIWP